ncbi:MAG: NAD(P)H-dependent glycerol-3-phosphate dehydrogenase [Clostridia bacterium]|nr:NAD(P)H-dependent glycerol-3-phosphate dehydrogenase [Clostridia bacterium]
MKLKVSVIGCGRWGSLITWYLAEKKGLDVTLYGRESSEHMQRFLHERRNDLLTLPDSVRLTTDVCCLRDSDVIVISINSQGLSAFMQEIAPLGLKNKIFVLCMKGIDIATGRRLSQVAQDGMDASNKVAVWIGPGHVQEFYAGIPNCMVIDSEDEETKHILVDAFSSELIRFYYGEDMIGNEIGAAAKNVIGIAAGMLDGHGLSTLKGALMSRGCREVARLISAMGGNELSAYGLCHLGDYEATVFSKFSHNRAFGEAFVKGDQLNKLAEGYYTVKAIMKLCQEYAVDMPICRAVYEIVYESKDAKETLNNLFERSIKTEFYK